MIVFLIRHGKTDCTENSLIFEDHKDYGLSPQGIKETTEILVPKLHTLPKPDLIITSELRRSKETASLVFREDQIPFVIMPPFNEIRKGFSRSIKNNIGFLDPTIKEWELRNMTEYFPPERLLRPYPSGISISQYIDTVIPGTKWILQQKKKVIYVFGHNGSIKSIIAYALGKKESYFSLTISHNCYTQLSIDNEKIVVEKTNA